MNKVFSNAVLLLCISMYYYKCCMRRYLTCVIFRTLKYICFLCIDFIQTLEDNFYKKVKYYIICCSVPYERFTHFFISFCFCEGFCCSFPILNAFCMFFIYVLKFSFSQIIVHCSSPTDDILYVKLQRYLSEWFFLLRLEISHDFRCTQVEFQVIWVSGSFLIIEFCFRK